MRRVIVSGKSVTNFSTLFIPWIRNEMVPADDIEEKERVV